MMRIITGSARGTRLETPDGLATRPTAERTKEAIFSMIQFDIYGAKVLDLFAGSGQMGLEALSRGAESALFCDHSKAAVAVVQKNAEKTRLFPKCRIECMGAEALLQKIARKIKFNIVFLDPPYHDGALPKSLNLLLQYELLANGAKVVCESIPGEALFNNPNVEDAYTVCKSVKYGACGVTLLQLTEKEKTNA